MPTLSVSPNGYFAGVPGRNKTNVRKRSYIKAGWSHDVTRRHLKFLYSVDHTRLSGVPFAYTLTTRDCPLTPVDYHRLIRSYIKRLQRKGVYRYHWLIEWQSRGVPHLHGIGYASSGLSPSDFVDHWIDVAAEYYALPGAQCVKPMHDSDGWHKYLAKHASRGVSHYQRQQDNMPKHWDTTGRMWGVSRNWPTRDLKLRVSYPVYHRLRRLQAKLDQSSARAAADYKRLARARKLLKCNDYSRSTVAGIHSWLPDDILLSYLNYLTAHQMGNIEAF